MTNQYGMKLYDSDETREIMLELSDKHIMWEVMNGNLTDNDYWTISNKYITKLEKAYKNLVIYCCGRSARHICIENTKKNRQRFWNVQNKCKKLQEAMIDEMNNFI